MNLHEVPCPVYFSSNIVCYFQGMQKYIDPKQQGEESENHGVLNQPKRKKTTAKQMQDNQDIER